MTPVDSSKRLGWPLIAVAGLVLMAGALVASFLMRAPSTDSPESALEVGDVVPPTSAAAPLQPGEPLPDVVMTLAADVVSLGGIVTQPASTGMVVSKVKVSGIVEPNTLRQVVVNAPSGGRVVDVIAEVGAQVVPGQVLARIESPELAQAQSQALAARTGVAAADQELQKIEKLMEVGAVSRQELDRVRSDRDLKATEFEAAKARLTVLGMSSDQVAVFFSSGAPSTTVTVTAASAGTVVETQVTRGQNVDPAMRMFTVADLSSVWIGADVPERDFARVRIGSPATVSVFDLPGTVLTGSVVFVDVQLNTTTHTARIRVEVANPTGELKAGMVADVEVGDAGSEEATLVPREALQTVADRQVVYLAPPTAPGRFIEREVHLGAASGDKVAITGIAAGDYIVVKGSAFLRTERERLGLR